MWIAILMACSVATGDCRVMAKDEPLASRVECEEASALAVAYFRNALTPRFGEYTIKTWCIAVDKGTDK